jgi:hypothetical protein
MGHGRHQASIDSSGGTTAVSESVPGSWALQEPQTERREDQDNPDVCYQPFPEVVPEEQDVHADHDGYQRKHVKRDGCLSSHRFVLLSAAEWSKSAAVAGDVCVGCWSP